MTSLIPTQPRWFLVTVVGLTSVVGFVGWLTMTFAISPGWEGFLSESAIRQVRGPLLHTLLQSMGATLALLTAICAFSHFSLIRDLTTAVMGAALLFAGLIDAFHVIVLDQFITHIEDTRQFGPFTWALSRIFHAGIVALGTGPFAWGNHTGLVRPNRNRWFLVAGFGLMGLGTFSMIQVCAHVEQLPEALLPFAAVPRPWDAAALMIYLLAGGILLPRFYRRHPSLFSYGLLLSLGPHILGEMIAAFWSRAPYDIPFFTAQSLKLIGYSVPLAGLLIDYSRVYRADGELRATREKLRMAREIQRGLLPAHPPEVPGYSIDGLCIPTDAVGGDFYDFLPMAGGRLGIAIADVSGHDLGAAILMSQARAYLRAEAAYSSDPATLLTRVNRFLCCDVRDRRFISLFVAMLDPETSHCEYAAAGHNGYVFGEHGVIRELPPTGPVLGVIETEYHAGDGVVLEPGESLVLITDGWFEAVSPSGQAFGLSRITDCLIAHQAASPQDALKMLYGAVLDHRWQATAEDDLTAVIVRRNVESAGSAESSTPSS